MTPPRYLNPARDLSRALLLAAAIGAAAAPAHAGSKWQQKKEREPIVHGALSGPPVMAVVSIREQRVSLYDAAGQSVRARVSSGAGGYETPVGTYSILQKNRDHYSNIYDAAAMPFMQRLTWSGVALHEGQLPGYPASHGCVRLPSSYAEQIFPLTRIGMRVLVAKDWVAPVPFSHPVLIQPKPVSESPDNIVATKIAYDTTENADPGTSVFEADVGKSAGRQAEMDALKADAAEKEALARTEKSKVESLKEIAGDKTQLRAAAAKVLAGAEKTKRIADAKLADAERQLASAKDPAKHKRWEAVQAKAEKAANSASAAVEAARSIVASATGEREKDRADRALDRAERAKRSADRELARATKDLEAIRSPARYRKEEERVQKFADAAKAVTAKYDAAKSALAAADEALARANQDLQAATALMEAASATAKEARRKTFPVSMFVSLKTQRLYVRQGHEPVVEVPVTIANPDKPLGTYVFTAVGYDEDANALKWTAVSPYNYGRMSDGESRRKSSIVSFEPAPTNAAMAAVALDRITFPADLVERFKVSAWPGSSLIISDEAASKETSNATDFIVLMSGEPQGGIKKRPKPQPQRYTYDTYGGGYYYGPGAYQSYGRYPQKPYRTYKVQPKGGGSFGWW